MLEINYLPGVTDNIASTTKEIINDNLKNEIKDFRVGSSKFFLLRGQRKEIEKIAKKEANPLIQTIKIYSYSDYKKFFVNNKFSLKQVKLPKKQYIKKDINLDISNISRLFLKYDSFVKLNTIQVK